MPNSGLAEELRVSVVLLASKALGPLYQALFVFSPTFRVLVEVCRPLLKAWMQITLYSMTLFVQMLFYTDFFNLPIVLLGQTFKS